MFATGFILPKTCFAQSDTLVDCFPLATRSQWVYQYYYYHWYFAPTLIEITDTGLVSYKILDSVELSDSIVWTFQEKRNYREVTKNPAQRSFDTLINDFATYDVIELKSGRHEVYRRNIAFYASLGTIIPFQRGMPDSAKMYRFWTVDTNGYTTFDLIDQRDECDLHLKLNSDSGLVYLFAFDTWYGDEHMSAKYKLLYRTVDAVRDNSSMNLPSKVSLSQNYPNPFNPQTTLQFSLPHESHVTLKVYNLLGQEVQTLVNDTRTAATYNAQFDSGKLSTGVYFYTLQAGVFMQTKKLLVIK